MDTELDGARTLEGLRTRRIPFAGTFEPVQHRCRAPRPDGQLCQRQDRLKVRRGRGAGTGAWGCPGRAPRLLTTEPEPCPGLLPGPRRRTLCLSLQIPAPWRVLTGSGGLGREGGARRPSTWLLRQRPPAWLERVSRLPRAEAAETGEG